MISILENIAKKIFPTKTLLTVRRLRDKDLIMTIQTYYANKTLDEDLIDTIAYITKYGCTMIPSKIGDTIITRKYSRVKVYYDEEVKLPYVFLSDKRLYYPKSWNKKRIQESYHNLEDIEQNINSPHRYLAASVATDAQDIVVDCGVAEGNFSLDVVDCVKKLYLFEPDPMWKEPLHATFSQWGEKVVIVQKYLSDNVSSDTITLNEYFKDKEYPSLIKMDIEGFEKRALIGASNLLSSDILKKIVVCTYHRANDESELTELLSKYHYLTQPAKGYMLVTWDGEEPYLRRGVIRGTKIKERDEL